jgi:exosortase
MRADTKYRLFIGLLTVGLLSALYFRTFIWLVDYWLGDPAYSHGFLVPAIAGFIVWKKRHELQIKLNSFGAGLIVLASGLFIYVISFFWRAQFGLAISFLIVISGLILYLYGTEAMRSLLFPVCFLVFGIPLPFLPSVTNSLQSFSAHYSSVVIGMMGIPVSTIGAEIHMEKSLFVIGAPCSGMHTLIALLALAALFAYFISCPSSSPVYRKSLIFIAALPIALVANISRIVSILLIANSYGSEAAMRFFHDFSSIVLFAIAFGCLVVCSRALGCGLKAKSIERF